jgi:hypothetical protein
MAMANGQDNWNGARTVLLQLGHVNMPQTPNGSLIFGYLNQAKVNNQGKLTLTSGGGAPIYLAAPAFIQMLGVHVQNWQASNLRVTNVSDATDTPILVQAFGPGIPGVQPGMLTPGQPVSLAVTQAVQGTTPAKATTLFRFSASSGNLSIVGVVGGPPQPPDNNNAYVIALNASSDTGPPNGTDPPPGYYATVVGNSYDLIVPWGTSALAYVVNLSPIAAATVSVTMIGL